MIATNPIKTALFASLLAIVAAPCYAQSYPDKPVRIVVPYPPGGIADTVVRAVGERLAKRLGQPVLVENKPGGKQMVATSAVVRSAPDGYTLLLGSVTSLSLNQATNVSQPYDVNRDLMPVSRLFYAPLVLVTSHSIGVKSVKELVAYAKNNPGKLAYASIGPGTSTHIAAELLKQQAGIDMMHVPYKGSAPAIADLLGGQVQLMFDGGTSSLPHVESGKLDLLAVTSNKRFAYLPNVPTIAESGFPSYDLTAWWGIVAPAGTPRAIIDRLSKEFIAITSEKDLADQFGKNGVALEAGSPDAFGKFISEETARWTKFMKTSGIQLD